MPDRVEVDTTGLDRMVARMRTRADDIGRRACADGAERVAAETRKMVPHRSGRLAASVDARPAAQGATVTMAAPYAGWIEYGGTRGRPYVSAGRYLGAAVKGADQDIARQAERDLEREARAW